MSMRATFTTEFIYDQSEGWEDRYKQMCEILDVKPFEKPHTIIGQISGIMKGLDLGESDIKRWLDEQAFDLYKITKVPFKIVYLLEGGDIIIKEIIPKT